MLCNLDNYMFSSQHPVFLRTPTSLKKQDVVKTLQSPVSPCASDNLHIPKFKDTLFWCYYIMKYGLTKYNMVNHVFKEKQKIKIDLIYLIRENKEQLKKMKYKRIKLENNLLYERKISLQTFFCLCHLNNFNVYVVEDNRYVQNKGVKGVTIIQKRNEQYGIMPLSTEYISKIVNKYWKVDDLDNPLKRFSSYKAQDLRDICKKLNINIYDKNNKKLNMKMLYKLILEQI